MVFAKVYCSPKLQQQNFEDSSNIQLFFWRKFPILDLFYWKYPNKDIEWPDYRIALLYFIIYQIFRKMNTKQLMFAILIVAATAAVALAPYLSSTTALAKKTCTVGQSSTSCNEHNRSTPAAHCRNPVGKEVNCHGNVS